MSALVVAGGWIEGLYISVNIANQNAKNDLLVIAEQKLILELIGLLETNEANDNAPKL